MGYHDVSGGVLKKRVNWDREKIFGQKSTLETICLIWLSLTFQWVAKIVVNACFQPSVTLLSGVNLTKIKD